MLDTRPLDPIDAHAGQATVLIVGPTYNPTLTDPIEALINRAGFEERDIDAGTSGLCGTFALALYRDLLKRGITSRLKLLCLVDEQGRPAYETGAVSGESGYDVVDILWRHVLVEKDGRLYDIDGLVQLDHVIENYCWGAIHRGGALHDVTFRDLTRLLRAMRHSSYDASYRARWRHRLRAA